eukprot:3797974-Ditylum_brightwellii.AAC.1
MPAANIVNRHAQILLGIDEEIHTKDIFKRIPCSIVGQWEANSFGMTRAYSPRYSNEEHRKRGGFSSFLQDVVLEKDGFFAVNAGFDVSVVGTANQVMFLSIDCSKTDPLVHKLRPFGNVKDVSRQQKCAMCMSEGQQKATSHYCGLCTVVAIRETDRNPTHHAYYAGGTYHCFGCRVANCFFFK